MSLVRLQHITKLYEPYLILDDISASIEHGDRIGLIGKNGSGKTTLTEIITGVIKDFKGKVTYAGGLGVGYLSQEPNLELNCMLRQEMLKVFQERLELEDEMFLISEEMEQRTDAGLLEAYARLQERHAQMGGYDYEHQINAFVA